MNRIERKLLYRTSALGLLLTAACIAFDFAGWLTPLERWLWDKRAKYCQVFNPPPTDRIVHVMIDDESLQTIGSWPWQRKVLAQVIDELTLADAKIIALDIFFPEPQPPGEVNNDEVFAASIKRSGRVLLPNSVEFRQSVAVDPLRAAAIGEFERDPELTAEDLRKRLQSRSLSKAEIDQNIGRLSVEPLKQAMLQRLTREIASTTQPTELRARLLPRDTATGVTSDATYLFDNALDLARAVQLLRQFGKSPPPAGVPLLHADAERAVSIAALTSQAAASGFVDVLPAEDGAVRSLPLIINYRDMAWPTMAFTLACMDLGAKLSECRIEADRIVIPSAAGERIVPVRTVESRIYGEVGTYFDIPWLGTTNWDQMYQTDRSSTHFLPIKVLWTIGQLEADIRRNNEMTDEALLSLVTLYPEVKVQKFLGQPPAQRTAIDRAAAVAAMSAVMLDDPAMAETWKPLESADPATLSVDDQKYLAAIRVLRRGVKPNESLQSLVEQGRSYIKSVVSGKVVIVGWSATGKLDFFPTSIHSGCPGGVIQGAVFNAIVTNHMLRTRPFWLQALITLIVGLICTAAVARLTPWMAFFAAVSTAGLYAFINGFVLYDWGNQIVGAAGAIVGAGATWSLLTLSKFINETRERSRITRRFRSYVDPALVDFVIEHPERMNLEGEVREVTVAFTDLAGFTSIAENLQERAVPILNQYMGLMVPIIRKHRGLVNKFLGDGIMFFYGAPREHPGKALAAVQTILEMNAALGPLNDELRRKNLPLVNMRAGVTTGRVVVGDAGAIEGDQQASDYTVLGDRVNLAARLEAANKAFGTAMLVEQLTYDQIKDEYLVRPIGRVKVKGKEEGVWLYEPLCAIKDSTAALAAEVQAYQQLVATYQAGDFDACRKAARSIADRFGEKKVLELYEGLCNYFSVPQHQAGFTGDIVLTEK